MVFNHLHDSEGLGTVSSFFYYARNPQRSIGPVFTLRVLWPLLWHIFRSSSSRWFRFKAENWRFEVASYYLSIDSKTPKETIKYWTSSSRWVDFCPISKQKKQKRKIRGSKWCEQLVEWPQSIGGDASSLPHAKSMQCHTNGVFSKKLAMMSVFSCSTERSIGDERQSIRDFFIVCLVPLGHNVSAGQNKTISSLVFGLKLITGRWLVVLLAVANDAYSRNGLAALDDRRVWRMLLDRRPTLQEERRRSAMKPFVARWTLVAVMMPCEGSIAKIKWRSRNARIGVAVIG